MRKTLSTSLLLLLASMLMLSSLSPAKAIRHEAITVDGDPDDWTGTPGADNTWVYDDTAGEWIWTDEVGDDTGNGSYTYPVANQTVDGVERLAFSPGDFDLKELRIAWNESHVFFLLRFVNLTDNNWVATHEAWISSPTIAETTAVAICIDTDRIPDSGMDIVDSQEDNNGSIRADILLPSSCLWEYIIEIALEDIVLWYYDGLFIKEAYRNFPIAANTTVYETIEFAVPIDLTGEAGLPDPDDETWALFAFVGSQDYQHFREVASAEVAATDPWAAGGGEGFGGADDVGPDPDAFDCAFFANKADQENALKDFGPGSTDYVEMPADEPLGPSYREIPEFPLPFAFALIAIVILAASFKLKKKLYT